MDGGGGGRRETEIGEGMENEIWEMGIEDERKDKWKQGNSKPVDNKESVQAASSCSILL